MAEPAPFNRGSAAASAHRILQQPQYRAARPSLLQRVVTRAVDDLEHALGRASDAVGGPVVLIVAISIVAILGVLIRVRLGRVPLATAVTGRGDRSGRRTARDYREEAASFAGRGEFADAVRATTRAMVRELEDRGVLEPSPGSTAATLSAQAARAVPAVGTDARLVAGVFDEVWFSGRQATSADAAATAAAELRVSKQRLRVLDRVPVDA